MQNLPEQIQQVEATIILDAKSSYDSMHSANGALELTEKRSAVEMLGFQEAAKREGLQVRWTHGEANLADSLTKP
eukprot:9555103-Alexandrium_andersonii.AAC.1